MMLRPPFASDLSSETHWKHEALSRPLVRGWCNEVFYHTTPHHATPRHTTPHHATPHHTTPHYTTPHHTTPHHTTPHHTTPHHTTPHHTTPHHTTPHHTTLPGGFVEKHDRRVVDKFKGNGKSLALAPREVACMGVLRRVQAQYAQDLLHLVVVW